MLIIKNIVNYDFAELEHLYDETISRMEDDRRLEGLPDHFRKTDDMLKAAQYICVICLAVITGILFCRADLRLALIPLFIMFIVLSTLWLLLHFHDREHEQPREIAKPGFTPSVQYHQFVRNRTLLSCFGSEIDDSNFLATLIAVEEGDTSRDCDATDKICITSILFRFDDSNRIGILTLDVKKGVVYYATDTNHILDD